ncbi:MAG: hypothetical protein QXU20_04380 [Candidatus Woesearchaeota archaeon]
MAEKTIIKPLKYAELGEDYSVLIIEQIKNLYLENKIEILNFIQDYLKEDKTFNELLIKKSKKYGYYSETAILTYHLLNTLLPKLQINKKNFEYALHRYERITRDTAIYSKNENLTKLLENDDFIHQVRTNLEEKLGFLEYLNFKIVEDNKKSVEEFKNSAEEGNYYFLINKESARILDYMIYKHDKIGEFITEISFYDTIDYFLDIESSLAGTIFDGKNIQEMLSNEAYEFFNYTVKTSFFVFVPYERAIFERICKNLKQNFKEYLNFKEKNKDNK